MRFARGRQRNPLAWGHCCMCGRVITDSDFNLQAVVAVVGPEGVVCCCSRHIEAGPGSAEWEEAIQKLAAAKGAQLAAAPESARVIELLEE